MDQVFRFDAESWCVVYCRPNCGTVRMTGNIATEDIADDYCQMVKKNGGHVFRKVQAGVLIAALQLIQS